MTTFNTWAGKVRWLAGETESEPFQIGDGLHLSFFFPTLVGSPTGPFAFQGMINQEGDFQGTIEDEAGAPVVMTPTFDFWHSLDGQRREVVPFYHLKLIAAGAPTVEYEARYVAKRP